MGSISFNLLSDPWSIHSCIHHSLIHSLFTIPLAYICSFINSSFIYSSLFHSFFHFLVPGMPRVLPGYWAQQAICLSTLSLDVKHSRCVQRQDPGCLKERRNKVHLLFPGPASCSVWVSPSRRRDAGCPLQIRSEMAVNASISGQEISDMQMRCKHMQITGIQFRS